MDRMQGKTAEKNSSFHFKNKIKKQNGKKSKRLFQNLFNKKPNLGRKKKQKRSSRSRKKISHKKIRKNKNKSKNLSRKKKRAFVKKKQKRSSRSRKKISHKKIRKNKNKSKNLSRKKKRAFVKKKQKRSSRSRKKISHKKIEKKDNQDNHIPIIYSVTKNHFNKDAPEHIEKLTGGLSGAAVYKITVDGQYYVVRFPRKRFENFDRFEYEINIQKAVAQENLAPRIVFHDPKNQVILMEYVEGDMITRELIAQDSFLENFAKAVQKLHQIKVEKRSLEEIFHGYAPLQEIIHYVKTSNGRRTLCHNDLHAFNLRYHNGVFKFIDYEHASEGDPMMDLVWICKRFFFTEREQEVFLKFYFNKNSIEEEIKEVEKWRKFSWMARTLEIDLPSH